MSINGPQSGIRFSGLASGLDVESIVTQLMSLEQFPIQRIQIQQAQLQARQTVFGQFRSGLLTLNSAATALNSVSSYKPNKASVADTTIASVSATDAAVPGTYAINVTQLAKAHKITSAPQSSTTSALGMAGSFLVNGKLVEVNADDTLQGIAAKINGVGSKVAATVINGGTNQAYLVVGSTETGVESTLKIADVNGGLANSLGLINGTSSVVNLTGSVAKSSGFSSDTATLQSQVGFGSSGTFTLGADVISFNTTNDSLQDIAARITATGNHTATVVSEKVNGVDTFRLSIDSASWPATYDDTNGFLKQIGVVQNGFANQVIEAKDAIATVDGIAVTSKSNTLSGVVGGMTINFLKEGATTVNVVQDTTAIKDKVRAFQNAYNQVIGFIRDNSDFDSETFETGILFGDQTTSQVENTLNNMLFNNVGTGALKNLADIGFTLDDKGLLELNESKLDTVITSQLDDLKKLMMATGSSTNSELTYVSSSNRTAASGATGYSVNITQAASKGNMLANNPFSLPASGAEVLTFGGALFGNGTIDFTVNAGTTLSMLISQINSDSRLKDLITASDDGGTLKIESKRYGTAGNFSLVSNLNAAPDNSGIGSTGGILTAGLDVAGTINGEDATGNGQYLLGKTGNLKTEGLQIQYTGSALGLVGNLIFNQGTASGIGFRINSFTDSVNGLISAVDQTLTSQVEDMTSRINQMTENLKLRESTLRLKFAAMEAAIGRLNQQGSQLGAIIGS